MKTIYLHTIHTQLVDDYSHRHHVNITKTANTLCCQHTDICVYVLQLSEKTLRFLLALLEEMFMVHNPLIINDSLKLAIRDNIFIPTQEKVIQTLQDYFQTHDIFNLEGYYRFRMENYNLKVYHLLYQIVKKNLHLGLDRVPMPTPDS